MLGKLASKVINKYPSWDVSVALRYLPIAESIKATGGTEDQILEVGSGPFGIVPYLGSDFKVTGADIDKSTGTASLKKVYASAENLPFKANSFPIVVSVDTLEHLPHEMRAKAISEMVRVSSSQIYLAFPSGKISSLVDKVIAYYYRLTHKEKLDFLDQHQAFGLPQEREVINQLKSAAKNHKKRISIKSYGNTNIILWVFLLLLGFSQVSFLTSIYHILLLSIPLIRHLNFPPAYRKILFVDIKK